MDSSQRQARRIDTHNLPSNNITMAKPETVRRIKSYSSASGYVFQYQFHDVHPTGSGVGADNEYIYYVSADRTKMYPIRIHVSREAVNRWSKQTDRTLTGTEEYAVAKMRLFQALDEVEDFGKSPRDLVVDETNLSDLLERLDL